MSLVPSVAPVVRADDRSKPPTSGPLTIINEASLNQAAYGGGGGGGGGAGPNLAVSSLTLPAYTSKTNGSITFAGGMAITDINSSDSIPQYFFDSDKPTANTSYDFVSSFASSITTFNIQQSFAQATSLCLASADNGNAIIFTNSPTSTLALVANPVVIPGNLQVSSINGAAPGGAGSGPDPVVSTLTAASTITAGSTIQGLAYTAPAIAGGGTYLKLGQGSPNQTTLFDVFSNNNDLDMRMDILGFSPGTGATVGINIFTDEANNRSKIQPQSGSKIVLDAWEIINVSTINGAPPGGGSAISTFNQLFTSTLACLNPASQNLVITGNNNNLVVDLETPLISRLRFTPSTSIGNGGGQGPFIKVEDQGSGNYTLSIQSDSAPALITSISSLTVSSINNAAPGGGSALQFSTLSIPGGAGLSSFSCQAATTSPLVSFSTVAGHVYQASVQARAQTFSSTIANGDSLGSEILDDNTGNDPIGFWPLQSISTLSAGGAYQFIGGSVTWKAAGTGASFAINTPQDAGVRIDNINLVDFGAI